MGILGGGAFSLSGATALTPEDLLQLPTIVVRDQRLLPPPEEWRYAQIPGFEILSGASDRETQKLLRDFQLFNDAIDVVWPGLKAHQPIPVSLILCRTGQQFAAFSAPEDPNARRGKASLLLRNAEQAAIIVNFGVQVLDVDPTSVSAKTAGSAGQAPESRNVQIGPANLQIEHYVHLYREYVRYLLSFNQPRLPAWLEEGLAQLLMGMRAEPKFIEFAKIEDPNLQPINARFDRAALIWGVSGEVADNSIREELDFNSALSRSKLMPLDEFFALDHDSAVARNPFIGRWSYQAKGLVHMWLYGENRRFNPGFAQFVARCTREPVTEAMFKECFGMSYQDMLLAFRLYVQNTAYQKQEFIARKGGGLLEPVPLVLRDATPAEVGRIKGEAQVLAGHPELARKEMGNAYLRGSVDGPLLASLGLLENAEGEPSRARKFLEASAKAQVMRPQAYLELAKLRWAEAKTKPADNGSVLLSEEQTRSILQPLFVARDQPPPRPETYELMADVLLASAMRPTKTDFGMLNQGVLMFPRRPSLLLHAAQLNGKFGDPAEALLMVNYGLSLAQTDEARSAFEEVKASLPPQPTP